MDRNGNRYPYGRGDRNGNRNPYGNGDRNPYGNGNRNPYGNGNRNGNRYLKDRNNKTNIRVFVILGEILVICILAFVIFLPGNTGEKTSGSTEERSDTSAVLSEPGMRALTADTGILSVNPDSGRRAGASVTAVIDEESACLAKEAAEKARIEQERLEEEARLEQERIRLEEEKNARASSAEGEAELRAAMYDYDAAIELLKEAKDFDKREDLAAKVKEYEAARDKLVKWPDNTQISHLFVHSLIVDTARAFRKGSSQPLGYNRYMTTVGEFKQMLESLYEKGYVLVSIHDIAERYVDADGAEKLRRKDIMLPEGKTPIVISQDDVNYYAYMDNDGFADRLVIGEDGKPTCQYTDTDGTVSYGEYDVLPIVDNFILEHPDFSYRGAKGILAVTGYEGALGYDTGWHMYDLDDPTQKAKLKAEQEAAKAVADAIKADGWEFASHSYTHTDMKKNSFEKVIYDTDKWEREVQPILGDTDIYLYPFGSDICDWKGYKGDKYEYLKKAGFWYFCNVDASRYWIQITDNYMRMGRINADGERMMKTPKKLDYFFDSAAILDKSRPALD